MYKNHKIFLKTITTIILGITVLISGCSKDNGSATVNIGILNFPCNRLTLSITGENIEEQFFDTGYQAGGITSHLFTAVIPAVDNVTFTIFSYSSSATEPDWGGSTTVTLRPGNQNIGLTMVPMTKITSLAQWINSATNKSVTVNFENIDPSLTKGYNIYRSTEENGGYKLVGTAPSTGVLYTDTVTDNRTYYYRVSVISKDGNEGMLCEPKLISSSSLDINQEILVAGTYVLTKAGKFELESSVSPGEILNVKGIYIEELTLVGGGGAGGAGGGGRSGTNGRAGGGGGGSGLQAILNDENIVNFISITIVIGAGGNNSYSGTALGGFGFPNGSNGSGYNGSQGGNGGGGGGASALVVDGVAKLTAGGGGGGGAGGGQDNGGAPGADGGANPGSGGFAGINAGGSGNVATRSGGGGKGRYQGFPISDANNWRQTGGGGGGYSSDGNDRDGGSGEGFNNGVDAVSLYFAPGDGGSGPGGGGGGGGGGGDSPLGLLGGAGGAGGAGYAKIVGKIIY